MEMIKRIITHSHMIQKFIDQDKRPLNTVFRKAFMIFVVLFASLSVSGMDRRKPQFNNEPAYLILPMPYSFPGIGDGMMLAGLAANTLDSYTDLYVVATSGAAEGGFLGIDDIHLIPETLVVNIYGSNLSTQLMNYQFRGMNTTKDEYQLLNIDHYSYQAADLWLSLFDRRVELIYNRIVMEIEINRIYDPDGRLLLEFDNPKRNRTETQEISLVIDYTDDAQDPWRGIRLKIGRSNNINRDDVCAEFYVLNASLSVYLPLGDSIRLAFNAQSSEAVVINEGQTAIGAIIEELGFSCTSYDRCSEPEQTLINKYLSERKYGTTRTLGGKDLLRAYPMDRYSGAHMNYYSAELRWNFSTGFKPFNFWIWKDIATSLQLAAFHETGSIAEVKEDLWEERRSSNGIGFRMVSASGIVYRADVAIGSEGSETTIMFQYPW